MYLIRRSDAASDWERLRIPVEGAALVPAAGGAVEIAVGRDPRAGAHVVPFVENDRCGAVLVAEPGVRSLFVDGRSPLGVEVLEERGEIVLAGARLYFTAREPLVVSLYDGAPADCSLCGASLAGARVIACANCGATTHEGALADGSERLCFSHRGCCPGCRLRREDFAWTPPEGA